ncbi:hypothetical protein RSAG8_13852, partial [Rhizoctonia solani AG-8 WAC10335]
MWPCLYLAITFAQSAFTYAQLDTDIPIGEQCGGAGWSSSTTCFTGGYCRPINESKVHSFCQLM